MFKAHQPEELSEEERVLPAEALVNPNNRLEHAGESGGMV
ncbi:sodium:proton antiporter|nr:sodium:proton antiporter [Candidatus Pantoea persica]